MPKPIVFLFSFLLIAANSFGQEECLLVLRGKVVHEENNEPIEGAYVWLIDSEKGAVTDSQGNFRISKICQGEQTLKVQYLGHKDNLEKVNIKSNMSITIRLMAEDVQLEGVEIPFPIGLDGDPHTIPGLGTRDGLHGGGEIDHVQLPLQRER